MHLLVSRLKFAATGTAPRCARMFVRHTLRAWLLPGLVEDAELVVSELVTNAVRATGTLAAHPGYAEAAGPPAVLGVQVRVSGDALFVEVWDGGGEQPLRPRAAGAAGPEDEGGRGLAIVGELSRRCGVARPECGGKVVWAELPAPQDRAAVEPYVPRGARELTPLPGPAQPPHPADAALESRAATLGAACGT